MYSIAMPDGTIQCPDGTSIEDCVRSKGYTPDSYIFVIAGRPVPMDSCPESGAEIDAIRAASGG